VWAVGFGIRGLFGVNQQKQHAFTRKLIKNKAGNTISGKHRIYNTGQQQTIHAEANAENTSGPHDESPHGGGRWAGWGQQKHFLLSTSLKTKVKNAFKSTPTDLGNGDRTLMKYHRSCKCSMSEAATHLCEVVTAPSHLQGASQL